MQVRDRLASTLFEQETLRGPAGLSALHDMRALLSQSQDIEIRRGLEADKCHCPKRDPTWRHVQACHSKFLRAQHSKGTIVEFCFECDIWIIGTSQWNSHCRSHLPEISSRRFLDPLEHNGVLVVAGFCPYCLNDGTLKMKVRLK